MADRVYIPEGYRSPLDVYETQRVIDFIKHAFQRELSVALNLKRVSAPLFAQHDEAAVRYIARARRSLEHEMQGMERDSAMYRESAAQLARIREWEEHYAEGI